MQTFVSAVNCQFLENAEIVSKRRTRQLKMGYWGAHSPLALVRISQLLAELQSKDTLGTCEYAPGAVTSCPGGRPHVCKLKEEMLGELEWRGETTPPILVVRHLKPKKGLLQS